MTNRKILEKASIQALSEILGYDEAKAYYLLLIKNENEFKKEFSYSKRYRLLKSLFNQEAAGKIKPGDQDFFNYIILPPTFLYLKPNNIEEEIINYLEKIYLKNQCEFLLSRFSQIILKDDLGLIIFLLKYFMKNNAKISYDNTKLKYILKEKSQSINIIKTIDKKRKFGIIDRNFAFEFFEVLNKNLL